MNDGHLNGLAGRPEERDDAAEAAGGEAFIQAVRDAIDGRAIVGINAEEQELLAAIGDWLLGLPEALANFEFAEESDVTTEPPIRPEDPIAQMLGLVEDSAISLDGKRLASVRKAAGLNIADVSRRLQQRGWDVSIKTVSAWERNLTNPPPATINAIAEVLNVAPDVIFAASQSSAQTLEVLFDDEMIAAFLDEWAREVDVPAKRLAAQSKRLLATAGRRNATSATPETLLAILRHFKNLPGFEGST
jgi:transcriptional regulator with XRE-family HTH domain